VSWWYSAQVGFTGADEEGKDFGNNFLYSGCGGERSNSPARVPQVLDQKQTTNW